jgi:putative toxin-antitoxin system antitoxin component (TIGR02293 family)
MNLTTTKTRAGGRKRPAMPKTTYGGSIGQPYRSQFEAVKLVTSGLPISAIARFQKTSGMTLDRIKQVIHISEGSFTRRKQTGRLSQEESERLLRLSRIYEQTVALYDRDAAGALEWLETRVPALGGQRPLDLLETEPGAREVEDLIGRIAHGIVS